jgi:hypothetical protein
MKIQDHSLFSVRLANVCKKKRRERLFIGEGSENRPLPISNFPFVKTSGDFSFGFPVHIDKDKN